MLPDLFQYKLTGRNPSSQLIMAKPKSFTFFQLLEQKTAAKVQTPATAFFVMNKMKSVRFSKKTMV